MLTVLIFQISIFATEKKSIMFSKLISSLFLLAFMFSYSSGFFGNNKCKEECGGEGALAEELKNGNYMCYYKRSWFFGMKEAEAASECEIRKCKLGEEKPADDQAKCWCERCEFDNLDMCYGVGERWVNTKECKFVFCGTGERPTKYENETRPLKYYGKHCELGSIH